ncbi:hypothetical protein VCEC0027_001815A, partial [Vibrio cholerae O1 str. EC-0027]
MVNTVMFNAGL